MPRPTGRRARVLPDGSPRRPAKHTPRNLSRFRRPEAASPQTVVRVLRPAVIKGRPPIRPPPPRAFFHTAFPVRPAQRFAAVK